MIGKSGLLVLAALSAATPACAALGQPSAPLSWTSPPVVKFPDVNRGAKADRLEAAQARAEGAPPPSGAR